MLVSLWFWVFILTFSGMVLSFEHQLIEPDPNSGSLERIGGARSERGKRSVNMFLKGITALRTLLSGAKNVRSQSLTFKNYEKRGDFDTALKDFHKVVPPEATLYKKNKRGKQGTKIWTGYVGNLKIHLKLPPSGKPKIEIIEEYAERVNDIRSRYKIMYKKAKE